MQTNEYFPLVGDMLAWPLDHAVPSYEFDFFHFKKAWICSFCCGTACAASVSFIVKLNFHSIVLKMDEACLKINSDFPQVGGRLGQFCAREKSVQFVGIVFDYTDN